MAPVGRPLCLPWGCQGSPPGHVFRGAVRSLGSTLFSPPASLWQMTHVLSLSLPV